MEDDRVPKGLGTWFVIHFAADMLFAVPLFILPRTTLTLLGWSCADPVATRLVAAALFGIGIESLIARNAPRSALIALLNLKIIWSGTAAVGLAASLLRGAPPFAVLILAIFAGFCGLWIYWRIKLGGSPPRHAAREIL